VSEKKGLQTRAAVARFMGVEAEDVERMVRLDRMPHVRVPAETRVTFKFFLPDLHAWLVERSRDNPSPRLASFEVFERAFLAAQPERKAPVRRVKTAA
jgi:hypothetical protein